MESNERLVGPDVDENLQPAQQIHNPNETPNIPTAEALRKSERDLLLVGGKIDVGQPPEARSYVAEVGRDAERLASLRRFMRRRGVAPISKDSIKDLIREPSFFDRPFVRTSLGLDIPFKYQLAASVPTLIAGIAGANAFLGTIPSQYITSAESAWVSVAAFAVSLAIKVWGSFKSPRASVPTNVEPLIVRRRI